MPPKRRHISVEESSEENHAPKRRRTNDYSHHNGRSGRINTFHYDEDESSSDYDLSRVSEEKSYNSEPDYPDEESRSESTRRGGSYDEESDDPDNEPTVVDLVEDPDLPSPDPRIAATRPRPRRIGLNNNGERHFLLPRTVNDELIHIDDEEPLSLFSPRSARAAHALLSEEEKVQRKREEDERKSEQLARRLLEQDLELNDHFVRAPQPQPRSSPQPGTEMTDEEFARMLQEQEDQMVHNDMSGYSTHSRRLLNAPRFVSPVHDDYSFLNLNSHSPSISFGRRGLHHHHGHRHHHHSPVGHMSYESLVNLEPVKVAAKNIHLLPVSVYNKENVKNSAQSQCSICLDDFETGDKVKTLPCFHAFHAACVDKWLAMNHVCPVCKKEVDTE